MNKESRIKSAVIAGYLIFALAAGFFSLLQRPTAKYFFPWSHFSMFSTYPNYHHRVVAYGIRKDAGPVQLELRDFFPMPRTFIARGSDRSIRNFVMNQRFNTEFCLYLLRSYNSRRAPGSPLAAVTVWLRSLPLKNSQLVAQERPLVTCAP